jgi:hypothetical protein
MPRKVKFEGTVHNFPDDATDDEIRQALSGLAGPGTQEPQQTGPTNDVGDFFKGLVGNTARALWTAAKRVGTPPAEIHEAISRGLAGPLAPLLLDLAAPYIEAGGKAVEATKAGDYPSAGAALARAALNTVAPGALEVGETIGSGRVAEGLGEATAMALPGLVEGLSLPKLVEGINLPGAAAAVRGSAAKNYRSILLPTKRGVPRAEQTAAALVEEKPWALTRGQLLAQAEAEKATAGPAAGAAYAGKPSVGAADIYSIFQDIEKMRARNATVQGPNGPVVVNEPLNAALDTLKENLTAMRKKRLGNIPAEVLDDWRDKLFRGQVDATGNLKSVNPGSAKSVERGLANSIRKVLDQKFPDAKMLNDTYKLWANTADFLEDARRAEIASKRGIVVGSSQGSGALVQRLMFRPVREIPARVAGIFDTVAWNTVSGAAKGSIANALASGNWKLAEMLLVGPAMAAATPTPNAPSLDGGIAVQP